MHRTAQQFRAHALRAFTLLFVFLITSSITTTIPFLIVTSIVAVLVFFLLLLPFSITSLGFQIALGRLLGDSTDEGLDARTSYQFLAAFFGSLLIWPVVALGWTLLVWYNQGVVGDLLGWADGWLTLGTTTSFAGLLAVYLFCFPLFWASGKSFAAAWDVWADTRKAWVRWRFPRQEKSRLETLISELTP